jgi:peptide chain release factor 1
MSDDKDNLLAKLETIEQRYRWLQEQISEPAATSDPQKLVPLSREKAKLAGVVEKYRQYRQADKSIEETRRILKQSEGEPELTAMASEELNQLQARQEQLLREIEDLLVIGDEAAVSSVIMEIRPGTGGGEAALFARNLYAMYVKYAEKRGWKTEQLDFSPTELGGFREVIFSVKGQAVWSELGYEAGTHRVQRVPQTESQGRIHTSAATVAVLPEPAELDIRINPADVIEHVSRAGGPGGQNVNKVSSAIRLEHIPTGITVNMREERSQHKNRAKAWRVLRSRVYEYYERQETAERDSKRKSMIGSGDRSEKIRTYNFPQNRVTDHRINLSLYSLDKIMAGDMEELVAALRDYDRRQRLKSL